MKVSYKKIKCSIDWNKKIVDHYYHLSAADFIPEEELTASHVFCIIQRGIIKRGKLSDFVR